MSSRHETKYYKTALRVRGSVRASDSFPFVAAGAAKGGNSETSAFDAMLIQSVQKRGLIQVIAHALFRQDRVVVV